MKSKWNPAEFTNWLAQQGSSVKEKALADLDGTRRKLYLEFMAFTDFYQNCHLEIRPSTVESRDPPWPDIYCIENGSPTCFELGEVVMQKVARAAHIASKSDGVHGGDVSTTEPLLDLFRSKCGKTYETGGHPLQLLMYFQVGHQYPIGRRNLSSLLQPGDFEACQFDTVYIYDRWDHKLLERLA
jgi:hypothetical protein